MMRALFSGVSGLKSHQTRMDVIGNNIANVNTTGFKSKRLNFADMLYQTTQAGSASNTETQRGGINPRQIGLGVKTGAINTSITTEGANQSTGNPFDLKLTGEAFFIVSDGTNTYYTRDGSFDVDDAGYLVMANTGYTVMGWTLPENAANDETATIVQGATVKPINVKQFTSYNPGSTTGAYFSGIIDKNDSNLLTETGRQVNLQFYDKMGYEYNLKFGIKPVENQGETTRDVTTSETYYDFNKKTLYAVDNSKVTYKKTTADGKTADYKSSSVAGLDEAINRIAKENRNVYGDEDDVNLSFRVVGNKIQIFVGNTIAVDATPEEEITVSDDAMSREFSKLWNDAHMVVHFSGDIGYSTTADGKDIIDIPTETLETLLGTIKAVVDPTNDDDGDGIDDDIADKAMTIPNLRITTKTYTDESGVDQTDRTVEVEGAGAGGSYGEADVKYSDMTQLFTKAESTRTMPSEVTTENIKAGGFMPGEYTMTLLGMTDSTGAAVDTSRLGEVTYALRYKPENGLFSYVGSEGNDTFTLNLSGINDENNFSDLTIDMSDTKNVDNEGKCTLEGLRSNGRKDGKWTGVSIATDGTVTVNYSNGMTRDIAQIAVATFGNAMGLENAGDNLYEESQSSGEASIVDIAASGTGYMTSGVLEMSNVDLAQEFTDMITTQRGFQANSRIITTSDSILEELVNLKR